MSLKNCHRVVYNLFTTIGLRAKLGSLTVRMFADKFWQWYDVFFLFKRMIIPFRSSFSNWSLCWTDRATSSAASLVISPKDRFSSWWEWDEHSYWLSFNHVIIWSALAKAIQHRHWSSTSTLRIGSPSLRVSDMALAPSDRTRQSPKLINCTLRRCFNA